MIRSLRKLSPNRPTSNQTATSALFRWGVLAVLLQFFITKNVLDVVAGRDVNIRVHPASFVVLFAVLYAFLRGSISFHRYCRESPGLMLFVVGIPFLAFYAAYFNGFSGTAFYIDSFWSPCLLAVLLETGSDNQKRTLGRILIALVVFNALIGLIESVTYNNWFPFVGPDTDIKQVQVQDDFRANAFYGHPLTASLITAMAFFLLYSMRMRFLYAAPIFVIMMVGLLEFGGRTALGITVVVSGLVAFYTLMIGIVRRNLKLDFVLAIVAAAIILPILVTIIVTQTTIADRIVDTLYFDGSAQVRTMQWVVLNYLTLRNWLFGVPLTELEALKYQIGLSGAEDIENFWLLLFLDLGGIGFVGFLVMFSAFLWHLARYGRGMNAWLLMFSALIINSSSNSLGSKSNDLFIEAAFLIAMSGYASYVRQPRRVAASTTRRLNRSEGALGAVVASRTRRLRKLMPRVS